MEESQDQVQPDQRWIEQYDPSSHSHYYYHTETHETTWEKPPGFEIKNMAKDNTCEAIVKIQSLFRGRQGRDRSTKVKSSRQHEWIEQYDPTTQRVYYYHTTSGSSQWEKPLTYCEGGRDETLAAALSIQCAFRSTQARKSVARKREPVWVEQYDPVTRRWYYYHIYDRAQIRMTRPETHEILKLIKTTNNNVITREHHASVVLQSMIRSTRARVRVNVERQHHDEACLRLWTKLCHELLELGHLIHEFKLTSEEQRAFPKLASGLAQASSRLTLLKHQLVFLRVGLVGADKKSLLLLDDAHDDDAHDDDTTSVTTSSPQGSAGSNPKSVHVQKQVLAKVRLECHAVHVNVHQHLTLEGLEVDSARLRQSWQDYCHVSSRLAKMRSSRREKALPYAKPKSTKAKNALELAIGCPKMLSEKTNAADVVVLGSINTTSKAYVQWHPQVMTAHDRVSELVRYVEGTLESVDRRAEAKLEIEARKFMRREERMQRQAEGCRDLIFASKRQEKDKLEVTQRAWTRGLDLRQRDAKAQSAKAKARLEQEQIRATRLAQERRLSRITSREQEVKTRGLWHAVEVGCSIEVLRTLVLKQLKFVRNHQRAKLRLDELHHPDTGETLIQVSVRWNHVHLVEYLLLEEHQVNVHQVDCFANQYSLLHDAARFGSIDVIPRLIEAGVAIDGQDAFGDTPVHWAIRYNQLQALMLLFESETGESTGLTPFWKALLVQNHRQRRPFDLIQHQIRTATPPLSSRSLQAQNTIYKIFHFLHQLEDRLPLRMKQEDLKTDVASSSSSSSSALKIKKKKSKSKNSLLKKRTSSKSTTVPESQDEPALPVQVDASDAELVGTLSASKGGIKELRQQHLKSKLEVSKMIHVFKERKQDGQHQRLLDIGTTWKRKGTTSGAR